MEEDNFRNDLPMLVKRDNVTLTVFASKDLVFNEDKLLSNSVISLYATHYFEDCESLHCRRDENELDHFCKTQPVKHLTICLIESFATPRNMQHNQLLFFGEGQRNFIKINGLILVSWSLPSVAAFKICFCNYIGIVIFLSSHPLLLHGFH